MITKKLGDYTTTVYKASKNTNSNATGNEKEIDTNKLILIN